MLKRFLSLLLIAAVVDCPMLCGAASVASAPEASGNKLCSCCHRCDKSLPAEEDSAPSDKSQDGAVCQCICNGAVVEQAPLQNFGVNGNCWAPILLTTSSLDRTASGAELTVLHAALQPNDGMNDGRARRCLLMSFLC